MLSVVSEENRWDITGSVLVTRLETFSLSNTEAVKLGQVELVRGEQVYASRFSSNRAYVVTFRRIGCEPMCFVEHDDGVQAPILAEQLLRLNIQERTHLPEDAGLDGRRVEQLVLWVGKVGGGGLGSCVGEAFPANVVDRPSCSGEGTACDAGSGPAGWSVPSCAPFMTRKSSGSMPHFSASGRALRVSKPKMWMVVSPTTEATR